MSEGRKRSRTHTRTEPRRRRPLPRDPSPSSLAAIPEVDLDRRARESPFWRRVARHGVVVREIPSTASLEEMPEADLDGASVTKNPYAERLRDAHEVVVRVGDHHVRLPLGKGRPKKGRETGASTPRSVRLPDAVWAELERRAAARGITVHGALREAVARWLAEDD